MAQRDPVPEFGKWESDVRYTAYFDRPRKPNTSSSNSKTVAPPANANRIHTSSRTHMTQDPNIVRQRHMEVPKATGGQYPSRTERQTRAEVGNPWMITNAPSHPRRETAYQGVGTHRAEYEIQTNHRRPSVGGGPGHPPSWERNNSSEIGGTTGRVPPLAPERSRLRPLAQGERTPIHRAGVPKFGEWNANGPSADYGFTQVFGQLRDQNRTSTSSVAAAEAPSTPSHRIENLNTNRRPKGCWPSWCSSG